MDEIRISREEAQQAYTRSLVRKKLETKGVERVRAEFADGVGFNPFKLDVMREWLLEKEAEAESVRHARLVQSAREERADLSNAESLRIARSAKNASWCAAIIAAIALGVAGYAALREFPVSQSGSAVAVPANGPTASSREALRQTTSAR